MCTIALCQCTVRASQTRRRGPLACVQHGRGSMCCSAAECIYPAKNRGHRRADKTSEANRKAMREICSTRYLFESRISVSLSKKTEPAQMPMKAPMTKVTVRPKDRSSCVRIDLARNHLATAMLHLHLPLQHLRQRRESASKTPKYQVRQIQLREIREQLRERLSGRFSGGFRERLSGRFSTSRERVHSHAAAAGSAPPPASRCTRDSESTSRGKNTDKSKIGTSSEFW